MSEDQKNRPHGAALEALETAAGTTGDATSTATETSGTAPRQEDEQHQASSGGPAKLSESAEDLFDFMGDSGRKFKKPKKETPASGVPAAKAEQKKPEPKKYPRVPVRYALLNQNIELPREDMLEDEIHEFLAVEWPELSKEQSRLVYDEKAQPGYIFVVTKGHTKGAVSGTVAGANAGANTGTAPKAPRTGTRVEPTRDGRTLSVLDEPPENPASTALFRLLTRDGVYEVRHTVAGGFVVRLDSPIEMREGFYLSAPRPPASLLREVIEGFRETAHEEALVNVMYDRITEVHSLVWPGQTRTPTRVDADYTPESSENFVVCQIHSHGLIPAFFSPTDDRDELRTGLYGVVGDLGSNIPQAVFRYSCGGAYREVDPGLIFAEEHPGEIRESVRTR